MQYFISISDLGDDLTDYVGRGYWVNADTLETEGDTLEELVDNAVIYTTDQDGDSGPQVSLLDLNDNLIARYQSMIEDELETLIDKQTIVVEEK